MISTNRQAKNSTVKITSKRLKRNLHGTKKSLNWHPDGTANLKKL